MSIACAQYSAAFDPAADPSSFPSCGSPNRLVKIYDGGAITAHERLDLKKKRLSFKKSHEEIRRGGDFHRNIGERNDIDRRIDHNNDDCEEVVSDPAGNVVHS